MGRIFFQLTPEIIDLIIFGMENQSNEYFVHIKNGSVASKAELADEHSVQEIEASSISVPDWLPSDGFQLMESFTASLHNPVHKKTLLAVLSSGRGAFRSFKKTVKENEVLTRQWYVHKEKIMKSRVVDWYNLNCDILKYNDINENTDDTDNLILSDFIFYTNSTKWERVIAEKAIKSIYESLSQEESILAEYIITKNRLFTDMPDNSPLMVSVESANGEFTGFINGRIIEVKSSNCVLAVCNNIWVEKQFRGMGLARHLIDEFSKNAVNLNAEKIIFELPDRNFVLKSTLAARGGTGFFTTTAVNL
jgi:hypothetical protein